MKQEAFQEEEINHKASRVYGSSWCLISKMNFVITDLLNFSPIGKPFYNSLGMVGTPHLPLLYFLFLIIKLQFLMKEFIFPDVNDLDTFFYWVGIS